MALGQDLQIKFNTGNLAGDKTEFPFSTAGGGELTPIDLGIIEFSDGSELDFLIYPPLHHNITLESPTSNTYRIESWEFDHNTPLAFNWSGSNVEFDLTLDRAGNLNNNFMLIPGVNLKKPIIDFALVDYGIVFGGSNVALDLTTDRIDTWNNINITIEVDTNNLTNEKPRYPIIDFEYSPKYYASAFGSTLSIDLTIDDLRLNHNLLVCKNPLDTDPYPEDGTLIFEFDSECDPGDLFYVDPINADNTLSASLEFSQLSGGTIVNNTTSSFDLDACTPTTDFNLTSCVSESSVYGKRLNIDINLCETLNNPAINTDTHNFDSPLDYYNYVCTDFELDGYAGSNVTFILAQDILIEDIDPEHGHYVEFDISAFNQFTFDPVHGAFTDADMNIYPAAKLDGDIVHGAYTDAELFTTIIFYDLDAIAGENLDAVVETFAAPEFEPVADHGSYGDFDLLTIPVIKLENAQHGAFTDGDLTVFPAIEVDMDFYSGEYTEGTVIVSVVIDGLAYHGSDASTDFETFPSEGLLIDDIQHGSNGSADLAYTPSLDMDAVGGFYADMVMNITTVLEADGYGGISVDADLTRVLPPELDADATAGSAVETDLALTRALFPRAYAGTYVDADLEDHPAQELELGSYHGSYGELTQLEESPFNTTGYHGTLVENVNLQVTVNFQLDEITHGSYADADEVYRAPTLDMEATHGADGFVSNFTVPEGEKIIAEAFGGESLTPDLHAPIHAILVPRPINASLAMYDGFGGIGGLNHCTLCPEELDPMFGDNVVRLGYDVLGISDQLIIDFDDTGFEPWNVCGGFDANFEWELQTNKRFEADAYAGEYCEMFIPLEVIALFGGDEVPLDRLYTYEYYAIIARAIFPMEEIKYETTAAVWDHPDDFVAFYEAYMKVDLTLTAFGQWYHGAYSVVDTIAVPKPSWTYALGDFANGQKVRIEFEPVDYVRFCKGYIIPNGNGVVFDFDSNLDEDCSIFLAAFGASVHDFSMQNNVRFYPKSNYHGSYAIATVVVQTFWTALAYHGHVVWAQLYDQADLEPKTFNHGSYAQAVFYEPPIDGAHGIAMEIDDLIVPGPAVRWVTETQCLPNEYIPLTPDGDQDFSAIEPDENGVIKIPNVPVEYIPYKVTLLAHCITYDDSQDEE